MTWTSSPPMMTEPFSDRGERRRDAKAPGGLKRGIEIAGLEQGGDLAFIGEENIDRAIGHEVEEFRPPAMHTEGIGEGQCDPAAGVMGGLDRLAEGGLAIGRVPEIALEIGDLGFCHQGGIDIIRPEADACAEIGRHGALGIRRHHDQAARGGRAIGRGRRVEGDPDRPDIMAEHFAQAVVAHPADEGRRAAEAGKPRHRVRRRTAGGFDAGLHLAVETVRLGIVDQGHGPFHQAGAVEEGLIRRGQNIDNGIANPQDIETRCSHDRP